jgi:hypothetical protein
MITLRILLQKMYRIKNKKMNVLCEGLKAFVGMLLLLLYFVGSIEVDTFHSTLHAGENAVLHSVQNEQDSCHRTIYHLEKRDGCDHSTHISAVKKCPACQVSSHSDHFLFSAALSEKPVIKSSYLSFSSVAPKEGSTRFTPSRGPPAS